MLKNLVRVPICVQLLRPKKLMEQSRRLKISYRSGAIKAMPPVVPFGMCGVIFTVVPGLFIGALISKNIANFLEENDLFVPSEDDDDD